MKKWLLSISLLLTAAVLYGLFWYRTVQPVRLTIGIYSGSYWGTSIGDRYQFFDEAIEIFEKTHPGIEVSYVSGIGIDSYSEWLAEQYMKGQGPDLFLVLPEDFSLLAASGALYPLDDLIRLNDGFDLSVYYEACQKAGQMENRQYALPFESVPTLMFVNKSLLREYGISMPAHDWTWDDFYDICSEITDASEAQTEKKAYAVFNYSWTDMLYANGAVLFSEDGKTCNLGSLRVREAVLFDQKLRELNNGYTVTARDFDEGRVAFRPFLYSEYKVYQPYPWRVKKYSNFEWDCVQMPSGPRGGNVCEIESTLIGMNARSRHKELAWDFMKLLCGDEEQQKKMYSSSARISPMIAVAEDKELLDNLFQDVPGDYEINPDVIHDIMSTGVSAPRFRRYSQAKIMAENAVDTALKSGKAIEEYLVSSQHDINIMLSS